MSKKWDVFISHASEDKEKVVRKLADSLTRLGVKVWYDETELAMGDSLSRSIDNGLAKSDFGIVVLSPNFFAKDWPEYELRGLVAKSSGRARNILPIWHNITREEVLNYSPPLADIFAGNTNEDLDDLALKIVSVVKPKLHTAILRKLAYERMRLNAKTVVTDVADLRPGPIRHVDLPKKMVNRVVLIRASLTEVYPQSLKKWLEGFQRDAHPTEEIEIWEGIASKYCTISERIPLTLKKRKDIFSFLLMASITSLESAIRLLKNLDFNEMESLIETFTPDKTIFLHSDDVLEPSITNSPEEWDRESFSGDVSKVDIEHLRQMARSLKDRISKKVT